jgi:hypothetical protein
LRDEPVFRIDIAIFNMARAIGVTADQMLPEAPLRKPLKQLHPRSSRPKAAPIVGEFPNA